MKLCQKKFRRDFHASFPRIVKQASAADTVVSRYCSGANHSQGSRAVRDDTIADIFSPARLRSRITKAYPSGLMRILLPVLSYCPIFTLQLLPKKFLFYLALTNMANPPHGGELK